MMHLCIIHQKYFNQSFKVKCTFIFFNEPLQSIYNLIFHIPQWLFEEPIIFYHCISLKSKWGKKVKIERQKLNRMPSQKKKTYIAIFSIENKSKTEIADDFSVTDFYDKLSCRKNYSARKNWIKESALTFCNNSYIFLNAIKWHFPLLAEFFLDFYVKWKSLDTKFYSI